MFVTSRALKEDYEGCQFPISFFLLSSHYDAAFEYLSSLDIDYTPDMPCRHEIQSYDYLYIDLDCHLGLPGFLGLVWYWTIGVFKYRRMVFQYFRTWQKRLALLEHLGLYSDVGIRILEYTSPRSLLFASFSPPKSLPFIKTFSI